MDSWPLNMGPLGCPETPVRNCHYSLRNNPEERSSHLPQGGSLQSYMIWLFKDSISRDKFIVTSNDPWVKWTKYPLMGFGCFVYELALCFTTPVGCGGGGHSRLMGSYHTLCTSGSVGAMICRSHPEYILSRLWCGALPRISFSAVWWTRVYFSSKITLVVFVT